MGRLGQAVSAAVLLAIPASAGAVDLVPHRAVYAMTLASTKSGSGIAGASGEMTYEFTDSCDGWTISNRTNLKFSYNEGDLVDSGWEFLTWESKDGLRYRFHVRSTRDGELSEEIDGIANLEGKGKKGIATYTLPEPLKLDLPKGTLFPTDHTNVLLAAAAAGEVVVPRVMFDGSGIEGAFLVNAVIGKSAPARETIRSPLLSGQSWRVSMAFFQHEGNESVPDYELRLNYYGNGVADQVLQDFGTFSLRGKLTKLEKLPKPDC